MLHSAPYSLGFTTLEKEDDVADLPVRGSIPSWLNGQLLRVGPAKFEVNGQPYNHWFDGLAMLYRFSFEAGRVGYANRYLRGNSYCESLAKGEIRHDSFATNRRRTWLEKLALVSKLKTGDNCNVNVSKVADDIIALTETPTPIRFDQETLKTLGPYHYQGDLEGQVSTAHPHFDYQRNCLYNYLLEFGRTSQYHVYSVSAKTRRRDRVATIPVKHPAYMHSFAMTERYLILTEFPHVTNSLRFLFGREPFIKKYRWQPERGTRFHVIDKDTGARVKTATSEPFFAFHHINAFERGKELVVDVAAYPDASVIGQLYLEQLRSDRPVIATAHLMRYRLNLDGGEHVSAERLAEPPLELPRIDYRNRSGRPYRYVYATGRQPAGEFIDNLVKIDTGSGASKVWYENGCYPGEPVFVAAPGTNENQGALVSVVLDSERQVSFLLVLDAGSFAELARVDLPHHVPFGFHGNFYTK